MNVCAVDHEADCKNKLTFIWLQSITKSNMLQIFHSNMLSNHKKEHEENKE